MKRKILKKLCFIILLCIMIVASLNVYNRWPGGSVYKHYFKNAKGKGLDVVKYDDEKNVYEDDNIKVKLKESIYDEGVHIAYMMFEISKKNGIVKMPSNIFGKIKNPTYYFDGRRYRFETPLHYERCYSKYSGGKLILYMRYHCLERDENKNMKIDLMDNYYEDKVLYSFNIKGDNYSKKYSGDGIELNISPLGVGIHCRVEMNEDSDKLYYINKKGKKIDLLSTEQMKNKHGVNDVSSAEGELEGKYIGDVVYFTDGDFINLEDFDDSKDVEFNGHLLSLEKD